MDRDIFDDMKIETGCTYISDLPYIKKQQRKNYMNFRLTS